MTIWHNSKMTTLYYSDEPANEDCPCVVRVDERGILVEYGEGEERRQYAGVSRGEGHYELEAVGFTGKACLHTFVGSVILEGSWIEEGYRGMWRIRLEA